MQNNGTSVLDRAEAAQVSPVIEGPEWFDAEPGAVLVRMHVPLTADQIAAVLYFECIEPDELTDMELWGQVACVLAACGMREIEDRAAKLGQIESDAAADYGWLAFVRQRAAEVTAR